MIHPWLGPGGWKHVVMILGYIGHNVSWCLLMSPAQAKDTAVWTNPVLWSLGMDSWMLCTSTWVGEDVEEPQESSRIQTSIHGGSGHREKLQIHVFTCVPMFSCYVFSDFKDKPGDMPFEDLPSVPGLGPPTQTDQMALEIPKRMMDCEDCGDIPFFRPYLRKWWPYHIWGCSIFFSDMAIFGEKRNPREQVAIRLSSNHHSWTQAPPNPILYTLYHPMKYHHTTRRQSSLHCLMHLREGWGIGTSWDATSIGIHWHDYSITGDIQYFWHHPIYNGR